MKSFSIIIGLLLILTGCNMPESENGGEETLPPKTSIQAADSQQLSYNNLVKKLAGTTAMDTTERFRFLMVDKKKSLLHFFSIQKKKQEYTLGAEFQTCIQVGTPRQSAYDESCRDLYQDEYSNLDQLLRSILENPRHDSSDTGEQEFYFQHFSMDDSVIYGTDQDIFALELYLAFLRLTQADEELIKTYEEKKSRLISM